MSNTEKAWHEMRKKLFETLLKEIESGEISSIKTMKIELEGRLKWTQKELGEES